MIHARLLAVVCVSATLFAAFARAGQNSPDDTDDLGWCNILVAHGARRIPSGEPFFLTSASRTTAMWRSEDFAISWSNSRRTFLLYTYPSLPQTVQFYGNVRPGGDTTWHSGVLPGSPREFARGHGSPPTVSCISRFREEDDLRCERILAHHAGSDEANRIYIRQSPSPRHGIYSTSSRRFALNFTGSMVSLTKVEESQSPLYYISRNSKFPVSSIAMQPAKFGKLPAPQLSCVRLAPIPTPPPLGGADTRPLVGGRGAAGVAKPNEFSYFSYSMSDSNVDLAEIRLGTLGGGEDPSDGFWFIAADEDEVPTLEGFKWDGKSCLSISRKEIVDPRKAVVFIGVFRFGGPATPFTIRVVENPAVAEC